MAEEVRLLVERAREGDREALSGLFERYRPRVVRFCLSFAPIREPDAHDITQEVFIRAMKGIGRLRETERFDGWLFAIVRTRCMTHLSKARRRLEEQQRLERTYETQRSAEIEQGTCQELEHGIVAEEIERLPASSMKEAGRMFYQEGQDTAAIAERLEAPISTVTTWLSRFRGKLRKRLVLRILALRGNDAGELP